MCSDDFYFSEEIWHEYVSTKNAKGSDKEKAIYATIMLDAEV